MKRMIVLAVSVLMFAGCATSVRYISYTSQKFHPKDPYYMMQVFTTAQKPPADQPYRVIGKVHINGEPSNGVSPEGLQEQAEVIARKKGADIIVNATTQNLVYNGVDYIPAHETVHAVGYGPYERVYVGHYHPAQYIPYTNSELVFTGELAVFVEGVRPDSTKK